MHLGGFGETLAAQPLRIFYAFFLPVENVGAGPAIQVEVEVKCQPLVNVNGAPRIAALGASSRVMLEIECSEPAALGDFWLTLTYKDVANKAWQTEAHYLAKTKCYEDVTIEELDSNCLAKRLMGDHRFVKRCP